MEQLPRDEFKGPVGAYGRFLRDPDENFALKAAPFLFAAVALLDLPVDAIVAPLGLAVDVADAVAAAATGLWWVPRTMVRTGAHCFHERAYYHTTPPLQMSYRPKPPAQRYTQPVYQTARPAHQAQKRGLR